MRAEDTVVSLGRSQRRRGDGDREPMRQLAFAMLLGPRTGKGSGFQLDRNRRQIGDPLHQGTRSRKEIQVAHIPNHPQIALRRGGTGAACAKLSQGLQAFVHLPGN
jgi:hypothetical protein